MPRKMKRSYLTSPRQEAREAYNRKLRSSIEDTARTKLEADVDLLEISDADKATVKRSIYHRIRDILLGHESVDQCLARAKKVLVKAPVRGCEVDVEQRLRMAAAQSGVLIAEGRDRDSRGPSKQRKQRARRGRR